MILSIFGTDRIIDQWDTMIPEAAGHEETIVQETEGLIEQSKAPNVEIQRANIASDIVNAVLGGGKRSFLVITNTTGDSLRPYKMFVNARDYGVNLHVSWYLIYQLGFWEGLLSFLSSIPVLGFLLLPNYALKRVSRAGQPEVQRLNVFEEQDLRIYVTNAHHCLLNSVDKLMLTLKQDPSKITRSSKGFLGIT